MNTEQTIKKIQELVPEIMELKFGCEVVEEINGIDVISKIDGFYLSHSKDKRKNFHFAKILGRPITLEDVLLAIEKTFDDWNADSQSNLNYLIKIWQFNKPFHEQSQETKDFIGDLLNK